MAKQVTFKSAMSKVPAKVWQKAKETPAGGGKFEIPDIQDGNYAARVVGARTGMTKGSPATPYVSFTLEVFDDAQYDGVKLDKFHGIKDLEKDLPRVVKTIKGMGYNIPDDLPPEEIEDLVAQIAKDEPEVVVAVKNDEYEDKKGETVRALLVYINQPYDGKVEQPKAAAKGKPAAKPSKPAARGRR